MTATALTIEPATGAGRVRFAIADAYNTTRRFVLRGMRQPDVIVGSLLMPVIFVVLFGYVFGSSISVPGGDYHSYLMSGLFAQSTLFSSATVAVAIATDMSEGVIDRFRTLPITRSSVLIGRAVSTMVLDLPSLAVMIACALIVGWRPAAGIGDAVLGFALLSLFGFAMTWVGVVVGLLARSPQAADGIGMLPAFLLGFISNVFVDPAKMPQWLALAAEWNPMSAVVAAARRLFGSPQATAMTDVWSLSHPIVTTIAMSLAVLAIFVPLAVRLYTRTVR